MVESLSVARPVRKALAMRLFTLTLLAVMLSALPLVPSMTLPPSTASSIGFEGTAYGQSAPLDRLEEKAEDIKQAIFTLATIFVLVALVFAGLRFLQGDPNSWRYLVYVFFGVILVYGGTEIVEWLRA